MKTTTLHRHIGLWALTLYGVGDILGAGVYGLVGKAAGTMGNTVWLGFLASMVAATFTALSYASLGSRYPKAGGAAYVTHRAFKNSFLAYVIGMAVLASALTSMAAASRVFAGYFQGIFSSLPLELIVIGFIFLLAAIVFWGIRESMWVNALCTIIELAGLIFILVIGFRYWGSVDLLDAKTPANPDGTLQLSIIMSGAVLTFYSFIGFEDILNVSEEVKKPEKTVPFALLLAVGIASVIYIAVSVTAVSVLPALQLAGSSQPLVDVVHKAAPWFPVTIYSVIALFAVANTALLNFVTGSRLLYGMGVQELLPKIVAKVHKQRRTPYFAILIVLAILLTLALTGDVSSLARATSVLVLFVFCVVNAGLVKLTLQEKRVKETFHVPSIIPILSSVICFAMLCFAEWKELRTGGIIVIAIAALYLLVRPKNPILQD